MLLCITAEVFLVMGTTKSSRLPDARRLPQLATTYQMADVATITQPGNRSVLQGLAMWLSLQSEQGVGGELERSGKHFILTKSNAS